MKVQFPEVAISLPFQDEAIFSWFQWSCLVYDMMVVLKDPSDMQHGFHSDGGVEGLSGSLPNDPPPSCHPASCVYFI